MSRPSRAGIFSRSAAGGVRVEAAIGSDWMFARSPLSHPPSGYVIYVAAAQRAPFVVANITKGISASPLREHAVKEPIGR